MNLEAVFAEQGAALPVDTAFKLDDPLFAELVHVHGEVRNNSGVVTLNALFKTDLRFDCDRCADSAALDYTGRISQTLVRGLSGGDDAWEYTVLPDAQLDLCEFVREELYLQLPAKLLCSPECRGLCPGCGANLNHTACVCKKQIDPRLAVLLPPPDDSEATL
jgi:uncharacterized protein